ncbi:MAG: hypothetical protein LBS55_06110 [Prevotellaceae bacterium]|jgi:hypothetical protein|nr:hypothetical protein [Prevotellaceae bacterium]
MKKISIQTMFGVTYKASGAFPKDVIISTETWENAIRLRQKADEINKITNYKFKY